LKRAIVSFASNGREDYVSVVTRVARTAIANHFDGDVILYMPGYSKTGINEFGSNKLFVINEYPNTKEYGPCSLHQLVPYQFKAFAIQAAIEAGYEQVIWMDSTVVTLTNLDHVTQFLRSVRCIMPDNAGCLESIFTSDDCLGMMGCSPERANTFSQIMACVMMFDFKGKNVMNIFKEYIEHSLDGVSFQGISGSDRPEFKAHRHDQSVISYLLEKYSIPHTPYGLLVYPQGSWHTDFKPCIINWGPHYMPKTFEDSLVNSIHIPIFDE
jgi:hypothetical protein